MSERSRSLRCMNLESFLRLAASDFCRAGSSPGSSYRAAIVAPRKRTSDALNIQCASGASSHRRRIPPRLYCCSARKSFASAKMMSATTKNQGSDDEAALLSRVEADILSFKRRTAIYSFFSLVFVVSQVSVATASTMFLVSEYFELGYIFSAITALLVTIEGSLAVRERAASSFATVQRLRGIHLQIRHVPDPDSRLAPLWEDFADALASRKLNYVEGIFMPLF